LCWDFWSIAFLAGILDKERTGFNAEFTEAGAQRSPRRDVVAQ
jgi:hypothetical protein